jgi:hypothetical protein
VVVVGVGVVVVVGVGVGVEMIPTLHIGSRPWSGSWSGSK